LRTGAEAILSSSQPVEPDGPERQGAPVPLPQLAGPGSLEIENWKLEIADWVALSSAGFNFQSQIFNFQFPIGGERRGCGLGMKMMMMMMMMMMKRKMKRMVARPAAPLY
jgi:hypothetical protein